MDKNGLSKILIHDTQMEIPIFNSIQSELNRTFIKSNDIDIKKLNLLDFKKVNKKRFPLIQILKTLPKKNSLFEFKGYIEGNHIMDGNVNVIVTDGFTGNIALKTAEGTAKLFQSHLNNAYQSSILSKLGYILSSISLRSVRERLDPRVHNCGIFMGLNALVVKCHGQSESKGVSYAENIIYSLLENDVNEKIKKYNVKN